MLPVVVVVALVIVEAMLFGSKAFIANSNNDIFANTFKNFALRDYEAVFVCAALRVGNASCQACDQEVSQTLGL